MSRTRVTRRTGQPRSWLLVVAAGCALTLAFTTATLTPREAALDAFVLSLAVRIGLLSCALVVLACLIGRRHDVPRDHRSPLAPHGAGGLPGSLPPAALFQHRVG